MVQRIDARAPSPDEEPFEKKNAIVDVQNEFDSLDSDEDDEAGPSTYFSGIYRFILLLIQKIRIIKSKVTLLHSHFYWTWLID